MSDLNQQPGLFDDLDDAPVDESAPVNEQLADSVIQTPKVVPLLSYLTEQHRVRVVDVKLAELLSGNNTEHDYDELFYIILMLCLSQQSQHSCLTLTEVDWANPFNLRQSDFTKLESTVPDTLSPFSDDFTTEAAINYLHAHHSVGDHKPLQLFNQRLYFSRLAGYEQTLAQRLLAMSERQLNIDDEVLTELLTRYFPDDPTLDIDWQKVACAIAATKGFSVITGGPGTGKTTKICNLISEKIADKSCVTAKSILHL